MPETLSLKRGGRVGARAMIQELRALVLIDLRFEPLAAYNHPYLQLHGIQRLLLTSLGTRYTCDSQRYACEQNVHTHKIKIKKTVDLETYREGKNHVEEGDEEEETKAEGDRNKQVQRIEEHRDWRETDRRNKSTPVSSRAPYLTSRSGIPARQENWIQQAREGQEGGPHS